MRELPRPPEIEDDPSATEMLRVWIADDRLRVSMLLGLWEEAYEGGIDERDAWGQLLADLARHIANGLQQSQDCDPEESLVSIMHAFVEHLQDEERPVDGRQFEE